MKSNEIDEKKTKYFVIAIILLILLSVLLIVHFNNKEVVSGDEDIKTTTTTTTTITTKKVKTTKKIKKQQAVKQEIKEESKEELVETPVYKSTVDEENKLVYNYKLTDEILNTDTIISKVLNVGDTLKNNNILALYDISLYDCNLVKKSVENSLIDISIPLSEDLLKYDNLKIVYVDENNFLTDEVFDSVIENGYIKFSTTHLSVFGIVGTKKEEVNEEIIEDIVDTPILEDDETLGDENDSVIDLSKVEVDVKINGEVIDDYSNVLVSTSDKIDVIVKGLEDINYDYTITYLLRDEEGLNEYQNYKSNMLEDVKTPGKYTLIIKINLVELEQRFEIGTFDVYDIVFKYDKNEVLEENVVIGEIKDEDGIESDYKSLEDNQNIVIDNVTVEEEVAEDVLDEENDSIDITFDDDLKSEPDNGVEDNIIDEEIIDTNITDDSSGNETSFDEDDLNDKATISLKGNVYLVEKTDISNLEITGHLIIDTDEDIVYDKNKLENVYSITIKSKEFSLNGIKYTYEYTKDGIVITRLDIVDGDEENSDIFEGFEHDSTKDVLIFNKKEDVNSEETKDEINEEIIEEEKQETIINE